MKRSWEGFYTHAEHVVPKLVDDIAARKACDTALKAYHAVGCRDVGRVDLRCDVDGEPCVMEINAHPGLRPDWSELCTIAEYAGVGYVTLVKGIVESALERVKS